MTAIALDTPASANRMAMLAELRSLTERILDSVIPPKGDVAYVEFSISPNVGNHLMWLATMNYLRSVGGGFDTSPTTLTTALKTSGVPSGVGPS